MKDRSLAAGRTRRNVMKMTVLVAAALCAAPAKWQRAAAQATPGEPPKTPPAPPNRSAPQGQAGPRTDECRQGCDCVGWRSDRATNLQPGYPGQAACDPGNPACRDPCECCGAVGSDIRNTPRGEAQELSPEWTPEWRGWENDPVGFGTPVQYPNKQGSGGPCFLSGTRIATAAGERAVEALAAGDLVATLHHGLQPIRAVRSHCYLRQVPGEPWPLDVRPIRIARSALAPGVPRADLFLTDTHAVFVDGALIPAGNLVNGTTICRDEARDLDVVEYFHIKLERHDILQAEGAACESLLEPGDTTGPCAPILTFNGGRSELASRLRSAASPLLDRRRPLDVIRDRLEERGAELSADTGFPI